MTHRSPVRTLATELTRAAALAHAFQTAQEFAMPPRMNGAASPTRVRLHRDTLVALHEWQADALRQGGTPPPYGKLLDQAVAMAKASGNDLVALMHAEGT